MFPAGKSTHLISDEEMGNLFRQLDKIEFDLSHDDSLERPGFQGPDRSQAVGSQVRFRKAPAYVELA
jgi:hypothetical protein